MFLDALHLFLKSLVFQMSNNGLDHEPPSSPLLPVRHEVVFGLPISVTPSPQGNSLISRLSEHKNTGVYILASQKNIPLL